MEVVDAEHLLLTNWEVHQVIKDDLKWCKKKENQSKGKRGEPNLIVPGLRDMSTLCYAVGNYMKDSESKYHTATTIKNLTKDLAPFNLTKVEKLQIVNNLPQKEVEIHVMVEEVEERFEGDGWEEIVAVIQKNVPNLPEDNVSGADGEVMKVNEEQDERWAKGEDMAVTE
eukprot:CFRG2423T1